MNCSFCQIAPSGYRAKEPIVEEAAKPLGNIQPLAWEWPKLFSGGVCKCCFLISCMLVLVLDHVHKFLCLSSGGGKVDPPDPLWAVHRVSGASSGAADQQQHGQNGRGGATRVHTGAHQTAGLLLQVQQTLIETVTFWPQHQKKVTILCYRELWSDLRFLTFCAVEMPAIYTPLISWLWSSWCRISIPAKST